MRRFGIRDAMRRVTVRGQIYVNHTCTKRRIYIYIYIYIIYIYIYIYASEFMTIMIGSASAERMHPGLLRCRESPSAFPLVWYGIKYNA